MNSSHAICLLGFTAFERDALASHFRLALQRQPAYRLVQALSQARFVVANADSAAAAAELSRAGRERDTVFVGARASASALACLPRPIDVLAVWRELDAAVLLRACETADPLSAPTQPDALLALDDDVEAEPTVPSALPAASPAPSMLSELADLFPDRQEARTAAAPRCDALIVDDSEIAQRFLQRRLADIGIRSHAVATSQAAVAYLARHRVRLALLDVELGPDSDNDGLTLCQIIKREVQPAPMVAMVSAYHGSTDRVRGSLAGCDAYLAKPVDAEELVAIAARARRSGAKRRAPADTRY